MGPLRCPICSYMMAPGERACPRCGTELRGRYVVVQALAAGVAVMFLPTLAFFTIRGSHCPVGFIDIVVAAGILAGALGVAWAVIQLVK